MTEPLNRSTGISIGLVLALVTSIGAATAWLTSKATALERTVGDRLTRTEERLSAVAHQLEGIAKSLETGTAWRIEIESRVRLLEATSTRHEQEIRALNHSED